jgi:hypothetical protein
MMTYLRPHYLPGRLNHRTCFKRSKPELFSKNILSFEEHTMAENKWNIAALLATQMIILSACH